MREGTRHRVAFDAYVGLGPNRSLERLHDVLAADPGRHRLKTAPGLRTLYRWSAALHWQDRIADLEREARRGDAAEHVEALRLMNDRHAQEGVALQQRAVQRLRALLDGELTPSEAIRALGEGVRIERLARGEVTDRTQVEGKDDDLDLSGFSLAELRALAAATEGTRPPRGARRDREARSDAAQLDAGVPDDRRATDAAAPGAP